MGIHRAFLNIGLVEGGIRATRGKEFSVSPELSDRLCRWERQENESQQRLLNKTPVYVKSEVGGGGYDGKVTKITRTPFSIIAILSARRAVVSRWVIQITVLTRSPDGRRDTSSIVSNMSFWACASSADVYMGYTRSGTRSVKTEGDWRRLEEIEGGAGTRGGGRRGR